MDMFTKLNLSPVTISKRTKELSAKSVYLSEIEDVFKQYTGTRLCLPSI